MAIQRDVTTLTPATQFADDGYVLVVQGNDIYALPKAIWTQEIYEKYQSDLDAWKNEFDTWYASVKGSFESSDQVASDVATLKNQIKLCIMDDGNVMKNGAEYSFPAGSVKMEDGNTAQSSIENLQTTAKELTAKTEGLGTYTELAGDPISVENNTSKTIQTITFTSEGTYMIDTDINFETNATGIRVCKFSPTKDDTSMTRSAVTAMPVSGVGTAITFQTIVSVNAGKTCYINVRHTAGKAINVNSRCRIVKLANAK